MVPGDLFPCARQFPQKGIFQLPNLGWEGAMERAPIPTARVLWAIWMHRDPSLSLELTLCLANTPSPGPPCSVSQGVNFLSSAVMGDVVGSLAGWGFNLSSPVTASQPPVEVPSLQSLSLPLVHEANRFAPSSLPFLQAWISAFSVLQVSYDHPSSF